jgi:ABC-type Fe3+-siderophore transport system permease subunit
MNFDLRLPIGIMFSFYGVLLVLYGLLGDQAQYARSLGININLIWGLVLLVFGALMLGLSWRSAGNKR